MVQENHKKTIDDIMKINEEILLKTLDLWQKRLDKYSNLTGKYSKGYKDAYLECISDITRILMPDKTTTTPEEEKEYFEGLMADNYLSSQECHDSRFV